MPFLQACVSGSKSRAGYKSFRLHLLTSEETDLLEGISRNQRRRWRSSFQKKRNCIQPGKRLKSERKALSGKRVRIVPWQILRILWKRGIKFQREPPERGMELNSFISALWAFICSCTDDKVRNLAMLIYEDTIRFETKSFVGPSREIFLKAGRGKFISLSQIRQTPGTI